MNQHPRINYPSQFVLLLALAGIGMVIGSFLALLIVSSQANVPFLQVPEAMNRPEFARLSGLVNTLASFFAFFVPALVVAKISGSKPFKRLGFNTKMNIQQLGLLLFITCAAIVVSGALGTVNEQLPLPESWLVKARQMEELYKKTILAMAQMKTIGDYLFALLVMALAPAIFEEVLFRGGLQQILGGWIKRPLPAIIITSILFSAIHFSYFGFLPRMWLGLVLGLVFFYSRNIWLSILLHFLNNAMVVTQLYILSSKGKPIDKAMDENSPVWLGIVGLIAFILLMRPFRKTSEQLTLTENTSL